MYNEQDRSLRVQRRYKYPDSTVAYSEPPTMMQPDSPPRHQRILNLQDPFEDHYRRERATHQQMNTQQRATFEAPPVDDPPRNPPISREGSNIVAGSHQDQVSLFAPTHDPLYEPISDFEDRGMEEPLVQNNHSVVLPNRNVSTNDHYENDDTSGDESSITEPITDIWSMEKAVNEVFRVLPESLCPRVPSVPKHKNRSGLEELNNEEIPNQEFLPQANIVRSMLSQLQSTRSVDSCLHGWTVPSSINREAISTRMYNRYAVSLEHFPIRVPALDPDASSIGLNNPVFTSVPTKLLEKWEGRSRMGVNIASHSDHFTVTLSQLLKDEKVSSVAIDRIMAALDKSKTSLLALSLQNATEMLSARRDSVLDGKANTLLPGTKDQLRAAPLSANTLFHGKIRDAAAADFTEQNRLCSAHVVASNRKRPLPSNKKSDKGGNHKPKKARMTPPIQQTTTKNVSFKKSYRSNNMRQGRQRSASSTKSVPIPRSRP